MNGQPSTNGENTDQVVAVLIGVVLGGLFLIWHFRFDLMRDWSAFMTPQAHFFAWLARTPVGRYMAHAMGDKPRTMGELYAYLAQTPPSQINLRYFLPMSKFIGRYVDWVGVPILLVAALQMARASMGTTAHYRRLKNYKEMFEYAHSEFLNGWTLLEDGDLYEGPFPAPQTPWYFAKKRDLVDKNNALKEDAARQVFEKQLGARFKSLSALKAKPYGWMVDHILSIVPDKQRKNVLRYAQRGHLYDTTVLLGLLFGARRFGVIPSSDFLSLRFKRPDFFGAMASAGRRVAFPEGAGIIAQYEYEMGILKTTKGRVKPVESRVQAAVIHLAQALETDPYEDPWVIDDSIWDNFDPTG